MPTGGDRDAAGWDQYWQHTREAAAHAGGGPQEQVLERFWLSFFGEVLARRASVRLLDLACGNGAVSRYALQASAAASLAAPTVVGLDHSLPAVQGWQRTVAGAPGVVADARRSPFADHTFDVVASQFGVEYAGPGAMSEAARLVRPGGAFAAVVHLRDGGIYRECAASLQAVEGVRGCRLLHHAAEVFRAASAARHGRGSKARYRRADEKLAGAVKSVENLLRTFGEGVAGGVVARLYRDIADMYQRVHAYDPEAITRWTTHMDRELVAYGARMSAMLDAAVDEAGLDDLIARLTAANLTPRIRQTMGMGPTNDDAAWALVCDR